MNLGQAVARTLGDLRKKTAIEPSPEVVTIKVSPAAYNTLWLEANPSYSEFVAGPPAQFWGYRLEIDPHVSEEQAVVVLHHEITVTAEGGTA